MEVRAQFSVSSSVFNETTAGGVGKSALTVRFVKDIFITNYDPTIEGKRLVYVLQPQADYTPESYQRIIEVDTTLYSVRSRFFVLRPRTHVDHQLDILDTAGAEQFHALTDSYIQVSWDANHPSILLKSSRMGVDLF